MYAVITQIVKFSKEIYHSQMQKFFTNEVRVMTYIYRHKMVTHKSVLWDFVSFETRSQHVALAGLELAR